MIGRIVEIADDRRHLFVSGGFMVVKDTEGDRKELGQVPLDDIAAVIANARQLECITAARRSLREGIEALTAGETLDAVSVCLEQSADALLTLTGRRASAEAIDKVFEQFCVGK